MNLVFVAGWTLASFLIATALGAGVSVMLLGRRWAHLWPAVAPIVGFCELIVLADLPSFFWGARTWSWPLAGLLMALNAFVAWRYFPRFAKGRFSLLALALPPLVLAVWPLLQEGLVTTLSNSNHDYIFYDALAQSLLRRGYASPELDPSLQTEIASWVLRYGGWRAGLPEISAFICALTNREVFQIEALVWAGFYATLGPVSLAALEFVSPRPTRGQRFAVYLPAVLGAPALMLLRDTFASQLASLPVVLLVGAVSLRGLLERRHGLWLLAGGLLAALMGILAEGVPFYLALLGCGGAGLFWRFRRLRSRIALRAVAIGALAVALVPATVARIIWQLESLLISTYRGARGASVGGIDPLAGDVMQLLPPLLGLGTRPILQVTRVTPLLLPALLLGIVAVAALLAWPRPRSPRGLAAAFVASVGVSYLAVLGGLQVVDQHYPSWKTALSFSVFVPVVIGVLVRVMPRRPAMALVSIWVVALGLTLAEQESRRETTGARAEVVSLAERLAALEGELFLVGALGSEDSIGWSHALSMVLADKGRPLHYVPHPYSYLAPVSERRLARAAEPRPRQGGRSYAVVVSRADADVAGSLVFQSGPISVYELAGPEAKALDFGVASTDCYQMERDSERRYRWCKGQVEVMATFEGHGCWVFEARALTDAWLRVGIGTQRENFLMSKEWQVFKIPVKAIGTLPIDLSYDGPVANVSGEERQLRFAMGQAHWEPSCDAP